MTPQQKIQAAIDALPNATGGEWKISEYDSSEVWVRLPVNPGIDYPHAIALQYTSGRDGPVLPKDQMAANATLIAAAKDLAEEVVRLRDEVQALGRLTRNREIEKLDVKPGDCVVVRIPGLRMEDVPRLAQMLEKRLPENVSALVLRDGQTLEVQSPCVVGMYAIDKMPEGKLVVGGLELCKQAEGSVWIQDSDSHEGFETPIIDLEHTLRGFWQANI